MQVNLRTSVSYSGSRYTLPEYAFRTPPELSGLVRQQYPVVIVGAGLVGLTTACALAQLGIAVVVLDDDNTVGARGASSRGVCYSQKSLEIFARLGIYERIHAKGVQWSVGRTFAGNDQLYEFDLAAQPNVRTSVQPAFINLQQFYVESFLVERIADLSAVDLRWQSKVRASRQDQRSVKLWVETPVGSYTLLADWVIDCSGANSPLRDVTAPRAVGTRSNDRWCICDVRFKHPPTLERRTWVAALFNDNRAVWQHAMADNVCRIDYQLDPDCDVEEATREDVIHERLRRQLGTEIEYEIVWVGAWTYRSECLDSFRSGRVLFAGDSAHVMSPFGARGGNSGIQDADNLAWKLALVVTGRANSALLDTYAQERRAAALENIRIADATARFLRPPNPPERVFRDAVLTLARRYPFARMLVNTGRMSQPSVYLDSRLNVGRYGGRSVPNVLLTMPDGSDGDLAQLMKWIGGRLVAVARKTSLHLMSLELRYPMRVVTAEQLGSGYTVLAAETGCPADGVIILRPDLYCAGCLESNDADELELAVKRLLGESCTSRIDWQVQTDGTRN